MAELKMFPAGNSLRLKDLFALFNLGREVAKELGVPDSNPVHVMRLLWQAYHAQCPPHGTRMVSWWRCSLHHTLNLQGHVCPECNRKTPSVVGNLRGETQEYT